MGIWMAHLKLQPDETIRWQVNANRVIGRRSTAGGKLAVTDRRLLFQPNRVDSMFRRKPWECRLDAVTNVDSTGRDGAKVLAGGLRDRLKVDTSDGSEVFVVNKLQEKVADLREMLLTNASRSGE